MNQLVEKILNYIGLDENKHQQLFEQRSLSDFKDAKNIDIFVKRILQAKANNEKVFVGGDYDADGLCATAIMIDTLRSLGIKCGYYIPNRLSEGYGLNSKIVSMVAERGYQLILTVDNGVKAFDAINVALDKGIDVYVSDHHTYEEELTVPLLHSFTMGYNYEYLSGAGIALAIARALDVQKPEHIILAGVATLGDMMQVWRENRVIIKEAVRYLNEGYCKSIQMFKSNYDKWNDTNILFNVVPKLNAAGRLPDKIKVNNVVEFLISDDDYFIKEFATQLENINKLRKEKTLEMSHRSAQLIKDYRFPVIHSHSFHEGIVGIVAGKIVSEYKRPAIVLTLKDEYLKGSARGIPGLDLVEYFNDFKHEFDQFGGHAGAAGLQIHYSKLDLLYQYVNTHPIPDYDEPLLRIELSELTIDNVRELDQLRPYGTGFKIPTMVLENIPVIQYIRFGANNHYKLVINDYIEVRYFNSPILPQTPLKTIKFNQISVRKERGKDKIVIIATN